MVTIRGADGGDGTGGATSALPLLRMTASRRLELLTKSSSIQRHMWKTVHVAHRMRAEGKVVKTVDPLAVAFVVHPVELVTRNSELLELPLELFVELELVSVTDGEKSRVPGRHRDVDGSAALSRPLLGGFPSFCRRRLRHCQRW